jgi:hypothetical protein
MNVRDKKIGRRDKCSAKQDEDDRVTTQEHLADESVLVHTLALVALGLLGPHLLYVLQHHVAVSVKSLDTGQQLPVITAGDQDLGVCAGSGLQKREGAGGELVLFDESDLIFPVRCAMHD